MKEVKKETSNFFRQKPSLFYTFLTVVEIIQKKRTEYYCHNETKKMSKVKL